MAAALIVFGHYHTNALTLGNLGLGDVDAGSRYTNLCVTGTPDSFTTHKGAIVRYGIIELTQGNLNNDHLYLTTIMELFPTNAIGGSSDAHRAEQLLEVHSGIGDPVVTDIVGDKKIFRKRTWVSEFIAGHGLKAGDRVVVECTGPYRYHVYPKR